MSVASNESDPELLRAINFVSHTFQTDPGYNIASKKKSPFSLIAAHVDAPYKRLVLKNLGHKNDSLFASFTPSKMANTKGYKGGSYFEKRIRALEFTEKRIRKSCRAELPLEIHHAMDSLVCLIEVVKSRKPKSMSHQHKKYCQLCWRKTEKELANTEMNFVKKKPTRLSSKYCEIHSVKKANWSNYIKSRRYQNDFLNELDNVLTSEGISKSKFYPILYWCLNLNDFVFPVEGEVRKMVYDLVNSEINSNKRLQVLALYINDYSPQKISTKLNMPAPTVYRNLSILKREVPKLLRSIYLCPWTKKPERYLGQIKFKNLFKLIESGSVDEISDITIQEAYYNVPDLNLKRIRQDLLSCSEYSHRTFLKNLQSTNF